MLRDINALAISALTLMEYVARSQEGRDDADSDPFMRQVATAADLSGKDHWKAGALYFRARALAKLVTQDKGAPGWTIRGENGCVFANECVFAVAAMEPLVVADGEFAFDRQRFLDRVLELSTPEVGQQ
jgi:hypothetical protein